MADLIKEEDRTVVEGLQAELAACAIIMEDLDKEINKLIQESGQLDQGAEEDVKEKNQKIGELMVKVRAANMKHSGIKDELSKYFTQRADISYKQTEEEKGEFQLQDTLPSFLAQNIPQHGNHGNAATGTKIAKPPKFKTGQDICIFLDRFEKYMILSGANQAGALDLRLLNLIEDDKMYRKITSIMSSISTTQKLSVSDFTAAIKSVLYPEAESRTLRDSMYKLRQASDESAEDFALRIEAEACKAFSPLEPTLKNEACLSALCNGLRSVEVRRKLKEAELKSFEVATRSAIKHEHIMTSTQDHDETEPITSSDFNVLRLNQVNHEQINDRQPQNHSSSHPAQNYNMQNNAQSSTQYNAASNRRPIVCYNCSRPGHIARFCNYPRSGQNRMQGNNQSNSINNRSCNICHRTNHYTNQCWYRDQNRNRRDTYRHTPASNSNNRNNNLNSNTTGEFPVHPSRRS